MVRRSADGVLLHSEANSMTEAGQNRATNLERFRDYLQVLARMQIDPRLRRDCDPSDIVQVVMLKANQGLDDFRGTTPEEQAGWLRQILVRTLVDALRDRLRARRDIRREVDLERSVNASSARLEACAASREPSPSAVVANKESAVLLAQALAQLPEPQREAVTLKHLEGRPLMEVANLMGRSPAAVASLLRRGLAQLRTSLVEKSSDESEPDRRHARA
jgi:RNA polymerase sigma-70 factor (ECF subfamily)